MALTGRNAKYKVYINYCLIILGLNGSVCSLMKVKECNYGMFW